MYWHYTEHQLQPLGLLSYPNLLSWPQVLWFLLAMAATQWYLSKCAIPGLKKPMKPGLENINPGLQFKFLNPEIAWIYPSTGIEIWRFFTLGGFSIQTKQKSTCCRQAPNSRNTQERECRPGVSIPHSPIFDCGNPFSRLSVVPEPAPWIAVIKRNWTARASPRSYISQHQFHGSSLWVAITSDLN